MIAVLMHKNKSIVKNSFPYKFLACFIHKLHNFCLVGPDHKINISICFNVSKSLVWPSSHIISVSVKSLRSRGLLNVRVVWMPQVNAVKHAVVWIKK